MMYEVKTLEQDLTAFFGCQLGLVVDSSIFRGQIPESVGNGVALRVTGTPEASSDDNPMYNVQILGKFFDRDDAWKLCTKCADLIPLYGIQTEHFHIVYILPDAGINAPVQIDDKGRTKQFASVNMRVSVLTKWA